MENKTNNVTIKSKLGKFAVIDPAYVLCEEHKWDQWCENDGRRGLYIIETKDGEADLFSYTTKYGDGIFEAMETRRSKQHVTPNTILQDTLREHLGASAPVGPVKSKQRFYVDSGHLAVVPAELWEDMSKRTLKRIREDGLLIEANELTVSLENDDLVVSDSKGHIITVLTSEDGI